MIYYTFLQPTDYRILHIEDAARDGKVCAPKSDERQKSGDPFDIVCWKETKYTSDSTQVTPLCVKYRVYNLNSLAKLLACGVEITVAIKRLVFRKNDGAMLNLGGSVKGQKSAVTVHGSATKSGRNSAISKQPSKVHKITYYTGIFVLSVLILAITT